MRLPSSGMIQIIFEAQSLSFALDDIGALVDFTAAAGTPRPASGSYLDSTTAPPKNLPAPAPCAASR
ncbi:MAG: hypothetical protein IPK63_17970 [Candidatus Competibacteraceae bacterium]|nr:hypothetical protein [Candidatus Competibacteraceae bacterium]